MSEKYSDDLLEGLTDEEREALKAPDDTTSTMEKAYDGSGDGEQAEKDGAKADDGQGDADGDGAADGKTAGAADADNGGDDAGAGQDDTGAADADAGAAPMAAAQLAPLLVAEAPADADAKLTEIGQKKSALSDQFENGDITAKEFQSGLDALNKEERTIERAVEKAQIAAEMRQQQETNNWLTQVQDFISAKQPEYSTSTVRYMALDAFVRQIGSDPANANMTGAQILAEAHKRVIDDLGEAKASGKTQAKAEGAPLKGSQAQPPKTLAKVPSADSNTVEDGRWSALDRLFEVDPLAAEEKVMRLSADERDAYLARA